MPGSGPNYSLLRMSEPKEAHFYLEDGLLNSARAGTHNFIGKIVSVLSTAGFEVTFHGNSTADLDASRTRPGYSMFHMQEPTTDRGLTFRRVYHYPFWAIEPTNERWNWRVAKAHFDPSQTDPAEAAKFYRRWQTRLFGDAPAKATREGFVYMPLQGKLLERRSFQLSSPTEMIMTVLQHDPKRQVVATLHPKETYSRDEQKRLDQLQERFAHLHLRTGGMETLLQGCDYVVTQNSSAAFNGYFFGKPCVLFAKSDFHHIATGVENLDVAAAIETVAETRPDYARYIHWFWQQMSINAGREGAEAKIKASLQRAGWPI